MTLGLSLTFCLLTDGGYAITSLLQFRVRTIQSFVGHAISIASSRNMVATSKYNGIECAMYIIDNQDFLLGCRQLTGPSRAGGGGGGGVIISSVIIPVVVICCTGSW